MGISSTLNWIVANICNDWGCCPDHINCIEICPGFSNRGSMGWSNVTGDRKCSCKSKRILRCFCTSWCTNWCNSCKFALIGALVSEEFFNTWGWRMPFLASAVLILISMYIQLNLEDTKAFRELGQKQRT